MSAVLTLTERESLTFACPWCHSLPGAWCLTATGRVAESLHLRRLALASPDESMTP